MHENIRQTTSIEALAVFVRCDAILLEPHFAHVDFDTFAVLDKQSCSTWQRIAVTSQ